MFPHSDLKFNHNLNHPKKTCFLSFLSLSDFKYRKWSNQDLNIGPICYAPTTTDCHRIWAGVFGTLNTGLHNPTLCQPSTWDGREWWGMTVGRFHVHVCSHGCFNKSNLKKCLLTATLAMNTLGEDSFFPLSLPNETQSPLPRKKGGWGEYQTKTNNSERSTSGDDQHTARDREVAFPWWQRRADADDFNTPSSAKGTHILSVYKSYSGVQAWEPLLQI